MGGKIYTFPVFSFKQLPCILDMIDSFFSEHAKEYDIIHCHMANAAGFYFWKARKYNINNLILHSHQPASSDIFSHKIRNYPLLLVANLLATERIACTKLAGDFLFKRKKYKIIKNAIEIERFLFNQSKRASIRKNYNWDNKIIIGHIGRFCAAKNQVFLIKIFNELLSRNNDFHLVLIGHGEDEVTIKKIINDYNIQDSVSIIESRPDVEDFYQAFDAFVFPSLYEGLGIVLVEAQCSGLSTFASLEQIPPDVYMTDCFHFVSLKESPKKWASIINDNIVSKRNSQFEQVEKAGYSIKREVEKLESLYIEMLRGNK